MLAGSIHTGMRAAEPGLEPPSAPETPPMAAPPAEGAPAPPPVDTSAPAPPAPTTPPVTTTPPAPGDPAAPTAPVSLEEAIRIAETNHGSVTVAEESVEAARQRVRIARTGTLPIVTGEIGYRGAGTSASGGGLSDGTRFDQGPQPRVVLNYEVFDGGLTRAAVRQAQANVLANRAGLGTTQNNLAYTVATNYFAQLRAERLLALRRSQEELAAEQLRSVEARIRVEEVAEAEQALPLSELRNRQVDRIEAENDVRVSANALRNVMGLLPGPPLRLVEREDAAATLPTVEALRATAERLRPEVIQAAARLRVAEQSVSIARIRRRPRLSTGLNVNLTPNNDQRAAWDVGAAISMPLWDAGLTRAQEREAQADLRASRAQLEQVRKDVTAEVEEAYLILVNARERLAASALAVDAARVNLESTTARFQRGVTGITVVNLSQAQVQYDTANTNAIQARFDVHLAQAQLERAIGEGPYAQADPVVGGPANPAPAPEDNP